MDTQLILWSVAGFVMALFVREWFSGLRRGQSEVAELRDEVKQMAIGFARLEQKLELWVDRVSTAHTIAPPPSASPMAAILDALTIMERMKSLGVIRVSAA